MIAIAGLLSHVTFHHLSMVRNIVPTDLFSWFVPKAHAKRWGGLYTYRYSQRRVETTWREETEKRDSGRVVWRE